MSIFEHQFPIFMQLAIVVQRINLHIIQTRWLESFVETQFKMKTTNILTLYFHGVHLQTLKLQLLG